MPTYEYKCTNDGSTFDLWQEVGSPAPPCPECGAPTKKVFQPPRVIFKGSGFYVTDKRAETSGGKSSDAKSESKADDANSENKGETTASDAKSEAKSETKTEAKTETPKADSGK